MAAEEGSGAPITQAAIVEFIRRTCPGVDIVTGTDGIAAGDTFFIYDPQRNLPANQRMPFVTIVTKDYGDFDAASNLNRPGVFRLNVGVSRDTFRALFGSVPREHDYAALDELLPHPVYAAQSWVCVLNPSVKTFESLQPLVREAYARVVARRQRSSGT